ncbi:hypothetical protein CFP56_000527 [Quercus suber]|uniref:Uncharacterized protein n=1 Tax=Quercus suber TaxID=58331 RepID=A0AAW0LH13_QUESU
MIEDVFYQDLSIQLGKVASAIEKISENQLNFDSLYEEVMKMDRFEVKRQFQPTTSSSQHNAVFSFNTELYKEYVESTAATDYKTRLSFPWGGWGGQGGNRCGWDGRGGDRWSGWRSVIHGSWIMGLVGDGDGWVWLERLGFSGFQ